MQLHEFYDRLLPKTGRYALFQDMRNTFYNSIEELTKATEKRIDTQGLYFATATYGDEKNDNGHYRRTQSNVVLLQAHRVDIDAGAAKFAKDPEGTYPTQQDALRDLITAVRGGLPMPTLIVSSGEGLHVYWQLLQAVSPTNWKPVAMALQAMGVSLGLRIDPTCTSDAARVLRPIGTLHKNGQRVSVLKDTGIVHNHMKLEEVLAPFMAKEDFQITTAIKAARSINDDVLQVNGPPASLALCAEHCAAIAEMRDKQGNVPEPLWRAVLGVAKYCEDGETTAHEWSRGYEGYSASETQQKLDRWEMPPSTCAHFATMFKGCSTCKYRDKITTPKQLGYIKAEEPEADVPPELPQASGFAVVEDSEDAVTTTADTPLPDRPDLFDQNNEFFFVRGTENWTLMYRFKEPRKDATDQKIMVEVTRPVAQRLFWVESTSMSGASDTGGVVAEIGKIANANTTRQERVHMPNSLLADRKALAKFLFDQGINLDPRNANAMQHVCTYLQKEVIRKQNEMKFVIRDRFGYHFHDGEFVCALGAHTVYRDGAVRKTIFNRALGQVGHSLGCAALPENSKGEWGPEVWDVVGPAAQRYVEFLRQHYNHKGYENARLALALSLASPLLVFTADAPITESAELPATGFVVSMFSTGSGRGKSSLQEVVAAAYGKPDLKRAGKREAMTAVAAATVAKTMAVYPFILDEVTQNESKQAAGMIDTFANGQGRIRARQDGSVAKSAETWALVTLLSTNVPQRELVALSQKQSNALLMRMIELDFDSLPMAGDQIEFSADLKQIGAEAGSFGLLLARAAVYVGAKKLMELASANMDRAYKALNATQDYRFFARAMAAMMTMNQLLGKLAPFNEKELIATFVKSVKDTKDFVDAHANSPVSQLSKFLNSMAGSIVVTKSWAARYQPGNGEVLMNPNVRAPFVGREVKEEGIVYISAPVFREWCAMEQLSFTNVMKSLEAEGVLVKVGGEPTVTRILTAGIASLPSSRMVLYAFRTRRERVGNVVPLSEDQAAVGT